MPPARGIAARPAAGGAPAFTWRGKLFSTVRKKSANFFTSHGKTAGGAGRSRFGRRPRRSPGRWGGKGRAIRIPPINRSCADKAARLGIWQPLRKPLFNFISGSQGKRSQNGRAWAVACPSRGVYAGSSLAPATFMPIRIQSFRIWAPELIHRFLVLI